MKHYEHEGAFVYYWRTNNGAEVDFVIEYQDKLIPIEVKGGVQIKKQSLRGMKSFIESQTKRGYPLALFFTEATM
ncbi:DUF4143 domain-containing protein [Desulfobacula sp.]|uniref:DUF4143 domain-containing protein n=1 Tax=Desulfobacula sp. TaxID=2593537 RepID=UPI00345C1CD5